MIIHSTMIDGIIRDFIGTEEQISEQCLLAGIPDPFLSQTIIKRSPQQARISSKQKFLSLPINVQFQFLTAWNNINSAIDAGFSQEVIIGYFDSLIIPQQLQQLAQSIRQDLLQVTTL